MSFSTDPTCWSQSEVARWLRQKMQELKIPAASCQPALQWAANFEGKGLVQITEQEFKARFPQVKIFYQFKTEARSAEELIISKESKGQVLTKQKLFKGHSIDHKNA